MASKKIWFRLVNSLMASLMVASSVTPAAYCLPSVAVKPIPVQSAKAKTRREADNPVPNMNVRTGEHKLKPVKPNTALSAVPTDLEIETCRAFQEPLIPMTGDKIAGENEALSKSLAEFKKANDLEDLSALEKFVTDFPKSRWTPSINLAMADLRFHRGYISQASRLWQSVWDATKDEKAPYQRVVANRAIADLLILDARVGRREELQKYLAEIEKRPFFGSDERKVRSAREGLWNMINKPECSFKCGPFAVNSILCLGKEKNGMSPEVEKAQSTTSGTSLVQVEQLAKKVGLDYQMAKRSKGAAVITPAVMHWGMDHFAALLGEDRGYYHLQDPTFDTDGQIWLSKKAIDEECDGYFLVPKTAQLPAGWTIVSADEGEKVRGKGVASSRNGNQQGDMAPDRCLISAQCPQSCSIGMAKASAYTMLASLKIDDTPLGYTPPLGPAIDFHVTYNHGQTNQPSSFSFSNLGQNWNLNWISYLTVDSVSGTATLRKPNGGSEVYVQSGGVYSPDFLTQALLVNMGGGVYQRQMNDGSIQVYSLSDTSSPPRIFMTSVIDAQGNAALIQYDANFRVVSITDAINQVSTITYVSNTVGNSGFYKIASISDPFSRSCSFLYDSTNTNLLSITDVVGLKSQFVSDSSSSFITAMTTPYGSTSFYNYVPGVDVYPAAGLRVTFPDGTSSVIENWLNEPKATYFWDRHATQLYPADPANKVYTHCEKTQFTLNAITNIEDSSAQNVTHPLESSPTYLTYAGQPTPNYTGTLNLPSRKTRSLGDNGNLITNATIGGTITTGDILYLGTNFSYASYTVQAGDTLTSIASGLAASINANATLQSYGVAAGAAGPTVSMLCQNNNSNSGYIYALSGGATETISLLSQQRQTQTCTLGGTIATGDGESLVVNFPYTVFNYTIQAGDTLATVASNFASQINANTTMQKYQTTAIASGNVIYLTSYYPYVQYYTFGTTGGLQFTFTAIRNGNTDTTDYQYNSLGKLTQTVDQVGRTFSYTYAANNIDLFEKRETQGTDNFLLGHWEYNTKHEPLVYIDGSGQKTQYAYNSSGQPITITDAANNVTTLTYTGTSSATIGGTITAGNVLTITVLDAGLPGGQQPINYTVLSTDTTTTIATALKNAINANTNLQGIGVSATSAAAVITLKSTSVNVTSYSKSTSGGATETITLGANTFGYLTKIDGPLAGSQDITTFTYDSFGRLATQTDSEGYKLTFAYDNMNRPTKTTYPDGTYEQTTWDKLDAVLTRDRNGRWTQKSFDSLDQLTYEIDPLGRKTQYVWCTCGSLLTLTDPAGHSTNWQHDLQGRVVAKVYQDSTTVNYVYEARTARLASRTDALNQTTNYFYQSDSNLYQKNYKNAVNTTLASSYFWDYNFNRMTGSQKNDWGGYTYSYYPYVTSAVGTPTTGGGMVQTVHNTVIANSDIVYQYDALGRTTNRSINGAANSDTWSYDAMSRVTGEVNALGTFAYNYVDDTPGSSKGTTRLASIGYPNSQTTKFSWYPTANDERLQQITNLNPSGALLSQFSYRYDPAGQITQWQQIQNNTSLNYALGYDQAGQLVSAQASGGALSQAMLNQNYYAYDLASNRIAAQSSSITRAKIAGTVTVGNMLTITVNDSGLTGGSKAINYTVQAGDTLSSIATGLAAAITADTDMQALGVNSSTNGAVLSIKSTSSNITTYAQSTSVGATETITLGVTGNFVENAIIAGTKKTGDTLTITVRDPALSGGQTAITYTVLSTDTLTTVATGLKTAINANTGLQAIGVSATSAGTVVTLRSNSVNATTYAQSVGTGATETITLLVNQNPILTAGLGGSKTTGDVITVTVYDSGLTGGSKADTYTVLAGDTLSTIATGIATAINADTSLQAIGVSAAATGTQIAFQSNSINATTYRATTSASATETILLDIPVNGTQTVSVGGTKTTGDVLTVTVYDPALTGGSKGINYTVLAGDTLASIAAGLAVAINADTSLQGINVSATSTTTVLSIKSGSNNLTTYISSTSGGATETLTLAPATTITQYTCNNVNALTNIAAGGPTKFQGVTNKAVKSASFNSTPAFLSWSESFSGNTNLSSGSNAVAVAATDGANNVRSNNYQVIANSLAATTVGFDANGNMVSNGANSYVWDAEYRLIQINYPGTGNFTRFTFDSRSKIAKLQEVSATVVTTTRQFVRTNTKQLEERDQNGSIVKQFFSLGQNVGASAYIYALDHLASIRGVCDASGNPVSILFNDPFGRTIQVAGSIQPDFQFGGYYFHKPSGLSITPYRSYLPTLARWTSRDPLAEKAGVNLYTYCFNAPTFASDPTGLLSGGDDLAVLLVGAEMGPTGLAVGLGIGIGIGIGGMLGGGGRGGGGRGNGGNGGRRDCDNLRCEIYRAMDTIDRRTNDLLNDPQLWNLYNTAYDTPNPAYPDKGTWTGHQQQLQGWKNRLKKLIDDAIKNNCEFPQSAWRFAYQDPPRFPRGWYPN